LSIISLYVPFLLVSVLSSLVFLAVVLTSRRSDFKPVAKVRLTVVERGHRLSVDVLYFLCVVLFMWIAICSWVATAIVFANAQLGWGPPQFGIASACVNIAVAVYEIKFQAKVIKCVGVKRCYAGCLIALSLSFMLFAICARLPPLHLAAVSLFMLAYTLLTFGAHAGSSCTSMILMLHYANPRNRGLLAGLLNTVRTFTQCTLPLVYLQIFKSGRADLVWFVASMSALIGLLWYVLSPTAGCKELRSKDGDKVSKGQN